MLMHETDILYSTSIAAAQVAQTFVEYYINFETNRLCLILLQYCNLHEMVTKNCSTLLANFQSYKYLLLDI